MVKKKKKRARKQLTPLEKIRKELDKLESLHEKENDIVEKINDIIEEEEDADCDFDKWEGTDQSLMENLELYVVLVMVGAIITIYYYNRWKQG